MFVAQSRLLMRKIVIEREESNFFNRSKHKQQDRFMTLRKRKEAAAILLTTAHC